MAERTKCLGHAHENVRRLRPGKSQWQDTVGVGFQGWNRTLWIFSRSRACVSASRNGCDAPGSSEGNAKMSAERPILIVDDDEALRETLAGQLAVDGEFLATEAGTIGEAEEKLASKDARFDAVILDVGLPDGDGRDLCTRLRRQGQKMPIIMLTGSDAETDVVRGLDSGANDYIAKPFRLNELLARLRAQLRIF